MPQGFDYTQPALDSLLVSEPVRKNFQALSTGNEGTTPPASPQVGFTWIDTSNPNNVKLKQYMDKPGFGLTWITLLEHIESNPTLGSATIAPEYHLTFYEGNNPPLMVNIDDFEFEDAAGFEPGVVEDLIFHLEPAVRYQTGMEFSLRFCMSTANAGVVKLQLDYRVKNLGDPVDGGTNYSTTMLLDPVNTANTIEEQDGLVIPAGRITDNTQAIHCRLTRLGTDIQDTHTGIFCLFGLEPKTI